MQWTVVNFSKVKKNTTGFRFDAEYFKPEFVNMENVIHSKDTINLGDLAFITDGQHGYHEVDASSPISHLTAKNAKHWFADNTIADRIAKWVDDKNRRSSLQQDDIILSTRGSVGFSALVDEKVLPANIDQDVARIAIFDEGLMPEYLVAFLNSNFGKSWLLRNSSGMVQQGLSLDKVRQIPTPKPTCTFQQLIKKIIILARNKLYSSYSILEEATSVFLNNLGLNDWQPQKQLTFVADYSEVADAQRFDADYYQPHYKELLERLQENQIKLHKFKVVGSINDKNYQPHPDNEYLYIELSNIGLSGEISGFTKALGEDLPTRARRVVQTGDVIISSIEGSLESVALISEKEDGALCSTGFFVARSTIYNPETLLIVMKSIVGQMQLKRGCSGTILTAISKDEIQKIELPEVSSETQDQIKQLVNQMSDAREESKRLLEVAKRAVEIAIEEDECSAFEYIETEIA